MFVDKIHMSLTKPSLNLYEDRSVKSAHAKIYFQKKRPKGDPRRSHPSEMGQRTIQPVTVNPTRPNINPVFMKFHHITPTDLCS